MTRYPEDLQLTPILPLPDGHSSEWPDVLHFDLWRRTRDSHHAVCLCAWTTGWSSDHLLGSCVTAGDDSLVIDHGRHSRKQQLWPLEWHWQYRVIASIWWWWGIADRRNANSAAPGRRSDLRESDARLRVFVSSTSSGGSSSPATAAADLVHSSTAAGSCCHGDSEWRRRRSDSSGCQGRWKTVKFLILPPPLDDDLCAF